jgi:hypothetical protein
MMAGSNRPLQILGGRMTLFSLASGPRTRFEQPYGCTCQAAAGLPGVPWLVIVAPFISQK